MIKKTLFFILIFYILTLIQTAFLVHFNARGIVPNLVFITVIFLNLFASHQSWIGVPSAFIGGFYLDIFSLSSTDFFGFYTLILVILALFIRFIFKKHVQVPIIKKL